MLQDLWARVEQDGWCVKCWHQSHACWAEQLPTVEKGVSLGNLMVHFWGSNPSKHLVLCCGCAVQVIKCSSFLSSLDASNQQICPLNVFRVWPKIWCLKHTDVSSKLKFQRSAKAVSQMDITLDWKVGKFNLANLRQHCFSPIYRFYCKNMWWSLNWSIMLQQNFLGSQQKKDSTHACHLK